MFRNIITKKISTLICTSIRFHQVTVLGGASEIGQTICLLLRGQPNITKLVVHDTQGHTPGIILDLSHVPTNATVKGYVGENTLEKALLGSEIVICAGGIIQRPGITEKLWLSTNTKFIKSMAKAAARLKPAPFIGLVTEPLNCLVPMAAEVMRNHGECDPKKLFGITNIDVLRARTLYAAEHALDPRFVNIPVIGGHSDKTCIPLLTQAQPSNFNERKAQDFVLKFQKLNDIVISAKKGVAPMLSIAYSALLFTRSVLAALEGHTSCVNALVENNDFGTEYFSALVHINEDGFKRMQTYPNISKFECNLLESSIEQLRKDVLKGKKILEMSP